MLSQKERAPSTHIYFIPLGSGGGKLFFLGRESGVYVCASLSIFYTCCKPLTGKCSYFVSRSLSLSLSLGFLFKNISLKLFSTPAAAVAAAAQQRESFQKPSDDDDAIARHKKLNLLANDSAEH